jgi:Tfp pilus assembly protein PilF
MDASYVEERSDTEKAKKEVDEALKKDPESHILKKASSQLGNQGKQK